MRSCCVLARVNLTHTSEKKRAHFFPGKMPRKGEKKEDSKVRNWVNERAVQKRTDIAEYVPLRRFSVGRQSHLHQLVVARLQMVLKKKL